MARTQFGVTEFLADPERNADPPHLAFGHGAHHCIARAELQEALGAMTSRLGCPTIGADAAWGPTFGINGPERLPITFTARLRSSDDRHCPRSAS